MALVCGSKRVLVDKVTLFTKLELSGRTRRCVASLRCLEFHPLYVRGRAQRSLVGGRPEGG
jgi:hypothetical protein